jgi:hypothetical protein
MSNEIKNLTELQRMKAAAHIAKQLNGLLIVDATIILEEAKMYITNSHHVNANSIEDFEKFNNLGNKPIVNIGDFLNEF